MSSSGSLSLSRYELPLGPAPLPMILLIPCPELSFRQVNWAVCTWGKRDSYSRTYGSRLDEHTLTHAERGRGIGKMRAGLTTPGSAGVVEDDPPADLVPAGGGDPACVLIRLASPAGLAPIIYESRGGDHSTSVDQVRFVPSCQTLLRCWTVCSPRRPCCHL